jgi:hypothetical protein
MASNSLGEADDDDLALHRELSPQERLDAILEAPRPTTQAVGSMQAMFGRSSDVSAHD